MTKFKFGIYMNSTILRLVLTFIFIMPWVVSLAQSITPNPNNRLKYIDILPPSPGVATLSNFSRASVGLSSGAAQFSVPLFNVAVKDFSFPVSLNYQSTGLKVDEIASRVGTGFQIEAGGSISRVVQGAADELSTFLKPPANTSTSSREFIDYLRKLDNSRADAQFDSQQDQFSFSFCGYSGKFILDSAKNVVLVPQTNLKFLKPDFTTSATSNFIIQDNSGNKFYFGGTGFTEKSKKDQTCAKSYDVYMPTAWFLKWIELNTGQIIDFQYQAVSYNYDLGINHTVYYNSPSNNPVPSGCAPCAVYPTSNDVCVNFINTQTYYLTTISTYDQRVTFNYTSRQDCGDVLLSSVQVASTLDLANTDTYELTYNTIQTTKFTNSHSQLFNNQNHYRPFLLNVIKREGSQFIDLYKFSYNDLTDLPVRLAYAQDHWGNYNGENNTTLVPKPTDFYVALNYPAATAKREAVAEKAAKGLLNKITFPTGGYDMIEYEPNTVFIPDMPVYPTQTQTLTDEVTGSGFNTEVTKNLGTVTIGFRQRISVNVTGINTTGGTPTQHHVGGVRLLGPSGQQIAVVPGESRNESVDLNPGSYQIELYAVGSIMKTQASLTFIPGNITYVDTNKPAMGVRVKKVLSYSNDNTQVDSKYYTYAALATLAESSGVTSSHTPSYLKGFTTRHYYSTTCEGCATTSCLIFDCQFGSLFSSSINSLFTYSGSAITYRNVIESRDQNFTAGLVEHEFNVVEDAPGTVLLGDGYPTGAPLTNLGVVWNGKEKTTTVYRNDGGTFKSLKRTNYTYKTSGTTAWFEACVVNKKFGGCAESYTGIPNAEEFVPFEAYRYNTFVPWLVADSVVEENFVDANVLRNVSRYEYNNSVSMLPTKVEVKDSKGLKTITNNYYPNDKDQISGLSAEEKAVLDEMVNRNIKSPLISQESYYNGNFNGRYLSTYKIWTGNHLLPESVKEFYVNGVEGKAFYITERDADGNILERKKDNGIIYSYLWDYKFTFPVAEIVGAAYSQVAATSFEADGTGNWTITGTVLNDATSPTGKKCLSSGSVQKSSLDVTKTYVVSYWYKAGTTVTVSGPGITISNQMTRPGPDGWTCVTMNISNTTSVTVSGSGGFIDEVRLYPINAKMTTITYDPMLGATSTTDTNNVTIHHEYDDFGRLKNVRDLDKNLLNTFKYNYWTSTPD